jgi:ABC-2 type transport system ATP-binding protein
VENGPVVLTTGLTKRYGSFTALDGLSIAVESGQILGFIGPNGAGKTTTIRILVGLLRATSGSATIAGADCMRDTRKIKRLVGYMPDVFGTYENMRVTEYLDFFGAAYGIGRRKRKLRIAEVLETAGASDLKDLFVESLSHGMRQRVAIARTLIHDPQVLILDEPANGLDPQARIDMRKLLLRLADMGKTLIVTSHILPELSRICSVIAIITHGKLRAFGPLAEIMRHIQQRRTFEVLLPRTEQLEQTRRLLLELEFTDDSKHVSTSSTESVVRFNSERNDEEMATLLAKLTGAGIAISQFREVALDLEDAFLSVTGEQKSAAKQPVAEEAAASVPAVSEE